MADNKNLNSAARLKQDEFYTQLCDIENELQHYREHFSGKIVLCNCNDSVDSGFVKFFSANFDLLKLNRLIAVSFGKSATIAELCAGSVNTRRLEGDGDFRSAECVAALREADIVVTNPPFSLFREYIAQLVTFDKKFLIIGNMNAITYKEIFPLIMQNKMWLGYGFKHDPKFKVPADYKERTTRFWIDKRGQHWRSFGNVTWYTNLDISKRHENIPLCKRYSPERYPQYDNYDAIEVGRTADIPCDYCGVMGVPITFLDKHNPAQFEILGCTYVYGDCGCHIDGTPWSAYLNGKGIYKRLFIRRRQDVH